MTATRRSELLDLLEYSRRMQVQAQAGDWEAVRDLQAEQHRLGERFFSEPVTSELAPECATVIREMLLANERIAELGQRERAAMVSDKRDFDRRRRAVRAYRDHSG